MIILHLITSSNTYRGITSTNSGHCLFRATGRFRVIIRTLEQYERQLERKAGDQVVQTTLNN